MTAAIIDLQMASEHSSCPSPSQLKNWVELALQDKNKDALELTIRIVDKEESQSLNKQYRDKDKPTNVLSFPFEAPPEIDLNLLGDMVICAPIVSEEANEQSKTEISHWAHMVVHGTLHLQGYDHIEDDEAEAMEALEIEILTTLGFQNPYMIEEKNNKSMSDDKSSNKTTNSPKKNTWFSKFSKSLSSEPESLIDVMEILRDAEVRHVIDADALSIIEGATQVTDMQVREVMIPRPQMILSLIHI